MHSNLAITKDYSTKLSQQTNKDESLQLLKKYYYEGWPKSKNKVSQLVKPYWNVQAEIHVVKDLLFKGSKLIVPQSMYKEMLDKIHEGHQGINKCLKLARDSLYWPNMSVDIKNLVEQCLICAKFKPANQKEPLQNFEINKYPWQQVGIDLINNAPPKTDNCLLSEIRLFDLQRGVDYVHSADDWLFAFDLFNGQCWRKVHVVEYE
ncbi:hypothetical protein HF086_000546 [Spodoptera exigua]|uniref:RNA-directed DNA polymerase n=1 Tax=Spodoptera exigua TaxID=7107 RepID=A0A922MPV4_SPOEX|nr:hypothetical protein HF086_000546 [Spodoptera exigua]